VLGIVTSFVLGLAASGSSKTNPAAVALLEETPNQQVVLRLLLDAGADPNKPNTSFRSPSPRSCRRRQDRNQLDSCSTPERIPTS
jgi:hypothetical protein